MAGNIREEGTADASSDGTDGRNDGIAKGRVGFGMEHSRDFEDFDEGGCHVRSAVPAPQHAWHG